MTHILDKYWANKKENVWDRLSKVHKVPSIENKLSLAATKSRSNTNFSQRPKIVKQIVINQTEYPQTIRKPLSPNIVSNNKRSGASRKVRSQKPIVIPEVEAQTFACEKDAMKSIQEILTVRSVSNSKSFSNEKRYENELKACKLMSCLNSLDQHNIEADISIDEHNSKSSEDSNEEYKLAPLMISPSQQSVESVKIVQNLNEILYYNERSIALEDIELVKDVIKSDKRSRNLDKNPKLFREILETQLQSILKHELAVKNALESLESSSNVQPTHSIEPVKSLKQIVSCSNFNKDNQKLEVDVVFKNVPSLEKEIVILRALGEKLEATLKSTSSHREKLVVTTGTCAATNDLLENVPKCVRAFSHLKYEKYVSRYENFIEYTVHSIGILYVIGIVKEFDVAEKTILELKQEARRPFYIPDCKDTVELKQTSFEILTNNPDKLLRYIKPKNCEIAFNVLEQDAIFFNSLFNKTFKFPGMSIDISEKDNYYENSQLTILHTLREEGDSQIWKNKIQRDQTANAKVILNDPITCEKKASLNIESNKPQYPLEPIIRSKQRRRIRRCLTPMPINNYCSPKNSLFKTVLVGIAQMSVFIIFIMALTYPDFIC